MSIADDKKMEALLAGHIRSQRIRILIHFVWILRLMAARSRKGKLRDGVESLVSFRFPLLLDRSLLVFWRACSHHSFFIIQQGPTILISCVNIVV